MHSIIFDLDRTLVKKNCSFSFYFFLLRRRLIPFKSLLKVVPIFFSYLAERLSLTQLHHRVFAAVLRGKPRSLFIQSVKPFLDENLEKWLNPAVFSRFCEAKKRGDRTFLLSSSPDFIVGAIAERLGFDLWKGTEYAVDKEERLCQISTLVNGITKLMLAKTLGQKKTIAYSDSEDDLPLLEWAEVAIVVQPGARLRRYANLRHWEIL
ncbi:MAG: HAD-IB family phosphatase [Chlamydiota bacterium]